VRAGTLLTLAAVRGTAEQLTQCATRHYLPVAVLAAAMNRRARHVLIMAAVIEGLIDYRRSGLRMNPVTYLLIRRMDDVAYGTGLWRGVMYQRTTAPLIPRLALRGRRAGRDRCSVPSGQGPARMPEPGQQKGHADLAGWRGAGLGDPTTDSGVTA
jgi:hypothetical protein